MLFAGQWPLFPSQFLAKGARSERAERGPVRIDTRRQCSMEDWIIGMVLVFVGCCCSAVGLILLKHSTNVEEHLPLHRRPFWAVGVVFLIVNASVIDVIAFSLAPLTLVAPFSGVTIVLATWLASSGMLFVKETVDTHDIISTALALVGVPITVPITAPNPRPTPNPSSHPGPCPDP